MAHAILQIFVLEEKILKHRKISKLYFIPEVTPGKQYVVYCWNVICMILCEVILRKNG